MSSWIPSKKKPKAPNNIIFKSAKSSGNKEFKLRIFIVKSHHIKKLKSIDTPPILTTGVTWTFLWFGKSTILNLFPIYLTQGPKEYDIKKQIIILKKAI